MSEQIPYNQALLATHFRLTHTAQTAARRAIFDVIWYENPCTIKSLIRSLSGRVHEATIYRTIPVFLKIGILETDYIGRLILTDRFRPHRHVFVCRNCRQEAPFHHPAIEEALRHRAERRQFALEDHRLELSGLCRLCLSRDNIKPRTPVGKGSRRPLGQP